MGREGTLSEITDYLAALLGMTSADLLVLVGVLGGWRMAAGFLATEETGRKGLV